MLAAAGLSPFFLHDFRTASLAAFPNVGNASPVGYDGGMDLLVSYNAPTWELIPLYLIVWSLIIVPPTIAAIWLFFMLKRRKFSLSELFCFVAYLGFVFLVEARIFVHH